MKKTHTYLIIVSIVLFAFLCIYGSLCYAQKASSPSPASSSGTAEKPLKPEEVFYKLWFSWLSNKVGQTPALIILFVLWSAMTLLLKEVVTDFYKWLKSIITLARARLFRKSDKEYLDWVVKEYKELRVGYKNFEIDVTRDYVSLVIKTGESEQDVERKEVNDVLAQSQFIVVRGHPGAGKTTLLKYLAIKYAQKDMESLHKKNLLPIFVPLKDTLNSESLLAYVEELFKGFFKDDQDYLMRQLTDGNCIVFFDGVDEVEKSLDKMLKWIENFRARFANNRIIVTLRKEGYETVRFHAQFNNTEIAGLTEPQIENLATNVLRANMPEEKYSDKDVHEKSLSLMGIVKGSKQLRVLAGNPLLLSIIALVYYERGDLPRKRVDLYEECVKLILGVREKQEKRVYRFKYSEEDKYYALRKISLYFVEKEKANFERKELEEQIKGIAPNLNLPETEIGDFIMELCKVGILRHISPIRDTYDFVHKTFLEYFAARQIQEDRDKNESLIYEHADERNWREVILLYVGLLGEPESVINRLLNNNHIALAGECFLNTRRPVEILRERIINALFNETTGQDIDIKDRSRHALTELAILNPDGKKYFFKTLIDRGEFIDFLKSRVNDPMEDSEVKKAIYKAGLELEPEKAEVFAEHVGMVYVPAGKSIIGVEEPEENRELPLQEVDLPAFFIDKYPVTNALYSQFIKAGGYKNSEYWSEEGWKYIKKGNRTEPYLWKDDNWNRPEQPVVGVYWYEADAYARWAGKELPLEKMWEKAARGTDQRKYPWGNELPDESRCNFNKNVGKTTPVGQYEAGKSLYGAYDMAGNVWEWCDDLYDYHEHYRVLRGGAHWNDEVAVRFGAAATVLTTGATTGVFAAPGRNPLPFILLPFTLLCRYDYYRFTLYNLVAYNKHFFIIQ